VTGLTAKEVSPSIPVEFRPQETVENLIPYSTEHPNQLNMKQRNSM